MEEKVAYLPATHATIANFLTDIVVNLSRPSSTASVAFAAICYVHKMTDNSDPSLSPQLQSLLRGFSNITTTPAKRATPIGGHYSIIFKMG